MKIRILIIIICLISLLVVTSILNSFNHNYTDQPEKSELIVMLGGGDEGRMMKAAELYHDGYADYVLITPVIEAEYSAQSTQLAMEYGIPKEALILEGEATSTYTNALITMDIMDELNMESALVVTTDIHIKRTKLIYDRVNDGSYQFNYISALSAEGLEWHEKSNAKNIWYNEFRNLWGYRLGLYKFIDT